MSKHVRSFAFASVIVLALVLARVAAAQSTNPSRELPPLPPPTDPLSEPPSAPPPSEPPPSEPPPAPPPVVLPPPVLDEPAPRREPGEQSDPEAGEPDEMSEGRRIVLAYNTGFLWGLAPGVVFAGSKASFVLGLRFGYGVDTGKVIVVPGVKISAYFTDPNVYLGMPVMKLIYPIDHFAPFIEGGGGLGHVAGYDIDSRTTVDAKTGLALLVGGGFMLHFSWKFGLGVEANYQTVTGTDFHGFGIGPILALAF